MRAYVDEQAGVVRSALLEAVGGSGGVPHAFTMRAGGKGVGVSTGEYASLNFGSPGNLPDAQRDTRANIAANWAIVCRAIGAEGREIVEVHQVHGAEVRVVHLGGRSHETADGKDTCADALVTDDPTRLVAVRVADCCPVLLAARDGHAVAAVHAGWRGVVQAILPATVRAMVERFAIRPRDLVAAIGPCIGGGGSLAFEVGPEVAAEFRRVFGDGTPHVRPAARDADHAEASGKALVDMQGALREQLLGCGVTADAIDTIGLCTMTGLDGRGRTRFFSHRRDRGVTGRMVGIIGPRDVAH